MWSGALDSSDLLLPYNIIALVLHNTITLITTHIQQLADTNTLTLVRIYEHTNIRIYEYTNRYVLSRAPIAEIFACLTGTGADGACACRLPLEGLTQIFSSLAHLAVRAGSVNVMVRLRY